MSKVENTHAIEHWLKIQAEKAVHLGVAGACSKARTDNDLIALLETFVRAASECPTAIEKGYLTHREASDHLIALSSTALRLAAFYDREFVQQGVEGKEPLTSGASD